MSPCAWHLGLRSLEIGDSISGDWASCVLYVSTIQSITTIHRSFSNQAAQEARRGSQEVTLPAVRAVSFVAVTAALPLTFCCSWP